MLIKILFQEFTRFFKFQNVVKKIKHISEQASGVLHPRGAYNEKYYLYRCLVGPVTGRGGGGVSGCNLLI